MNKPVSTAVSTALGLKANSASPTLTTPTISGCIFTGTISGLTKTTVGLSNVDNTSDLNKAISSASQTASNLIQSQKCIFDTKY